MINLRFIELIISYSTLVVAYVICTVLAGYFQAWVAKKAGDTTAEEAGFLTFNPMAHIDPIGALCLLFLHIGWGRFMPINAFMLRNNFFLLLVLLSNAFMYAFVGF